MTQCRRAAVWGALLIGLTAAAQTSAQPYPGKPVRLFTGSAPGGGADQTARVIAERMSRVLKEQVIVENRPGATGMIANRLVSNAAPDGYTLLLEPSSFVAISPHLNAKDGWDPVKRLAPIAQVSAYGLVLVVHPSVPAKNVKSLIALARTQPGVLNFCSSGVGSNFHLAGELFKLGSKIDIVHVPYRGSSAATVDLLAGRADLMFGLVPVTLPYIKAGRLRALAVTTTQRNPLLSDIPTIDEAALPGFEVVSWEGMFAPAGTPREIVAKLNATIASILRAPDVQKIWADKGVERVTGTPAALGARLRGDYERLGQLLERIGLKP
jgi:tripartite-type tricarboxylate transporter receptor subunit TctC